MAENEADPGWNQTHTRNRNQNEQDDDLDHENIIDDFDSNNSTTVNVHVHIIMRRRAPAAPVCSISVPTAQLQQHSPELLQSPAATLPSAAPVQRQRQAEQTWIQNNKRQKAYTFDRWGLMVVGVLFLLLLAYRGLQWVYPKTIYHKFLAIPQVHQLLEAAPAPHQEQYVIIVTNSNGKQPYNVAVGKSHESAENALSMALQKLPLPSAPYSWYQIDIVNAVKTIHEFDFSKPLDAPSCWYGLALDWDLDWVLTPAEVASQALVDAQHRLRWDRIGEYTRTRRHMLTSSSSGDVSGTGTGDDFMGIQEDDTTILPTLQILHTTNIFVHDAKQAVPLYHGHVTVDSLTHRILMEAAIKAGKYMTESVRLDGTQVHWYKPQSDTEPNDYGTSYNLALHSATLYAMACLYQEWHNDDLKHAMQRSMTFLQTKIHDNCAIPNASTNHTATSSKCVLDHDEGTLSTSKLGDNAMAVLAMVEYQLATGNEEYLETAISIATWIQGAQHDNGSFVQKVIYPAKEIEEEYYVRYYIGQASFALARLYHVVGPTNTEWLNVAKKATDYLIKSDSELSEEDLPIDHWLLYAISELFAVGDKNPNRIEYAMRTVPVAERLQTQHLVPGEDLDHLGLLRGNTVTKTEGLCTIYNIALGMDLTEEVHRIEHIVQLSQQYQLQAQYQPAQAMYMKDPQRVLGGFRKSVNDWDIHMDQTQHHLKSLLCMARLVKEMEVPWAQ